MTSPYDGLDRPHVATRPRHPVPVRIDALTAALGPAVTIHEPAGHADASGAVTLTGVSLSSQRVLPGDLYAALPGSRSHGIAFVAGALQDGAVAVLTDSDGLARMGDPTVPVLVTERPRALLGAVARLVYGDPAAAMRMIGVTGTQGKTTSTRLAEGALLEAGVRAAVVGTVGTRIAGRDVRTTLTTPEAPDLHGLFARMREEDVAACAMEVSSHALVMGRVDGVVFDVAVFLNLGRDHLDFHRDIEDYYQAKASLFTPERARLGLVNIDDEHGRRLAAQAPIPVRTLSTHDAAADWTATDVALGPDGSDFTLRGPGGVELRARCPLPGDYNVVNSLAALAAIGEAGLPEGTLEAAASALGRGAGVPGRLERIDEGQDFTLVVDYAHKPDAVEAALHTLRPLTRGRVIAVLGAGGDRDAGKRPIMGEIAGRLADVLIVTDDNPRSEDPAAIRAAVLAGTTSAAAEVLEIGDRRAAIVEAVRRAAPGDIVLVAGKGHETGQEVGGVVHPFDDRDVAREALATRR
ncbi:UDP-N-acetylmuramoyl-L-alanyl-D-glutamate--2,6-diaminopimelate ligase [Nocardioides sp. DS6]|uniref:UDP-N-acetylmuramoyl-L-alanyl-D-glutamate--2,6-diaminopimelate ligase n=1 Tax=Nocardioides eburneus TaxID=3231482 RepID=A0ABV3SZM8_9ACTN